MLLLFLQTFYPYPFCCSSSCSSGFPSSCSRFHCRFSSCCSCFLSCFLFCGSSCLPPRSSCSPSSCSCFPCSLSHAAPHAAPILVPAFPPAYHFKDPYAFPAFLTSFPACFPPAFLFMNPHAVPQAAPAFPLDFPHAAPSAAPASPHADLDDEFERLFNMYRGPEGDKDSDISDKEDEQVVPQFNVICSVENSGPVCLENSSEGDDSLSTSGLSSSTRRCREECNEAAAKRPRQSDESDSD